MNYDVFYTKLIEREDNARLHLKNKAKKEEGGSGAATYLLWSFILLTLPLIFLSVFMDAPRIQNCVWGANFLFCVFGLFCTIGMNYELKKINQIKEKNDPVALDKTLFLGSWSNLDKTNSNPLQKIIFYLSLTSLFLSALINGYIILLFLNLIWFLLVISSLSAIKDEIVERKSQIEFGTSIEYLEKDVDFS